MDWLSRRLLWPWLAVAFAALYAIHLGTSELTPIDESRSGVIVRECLEGDALLPRTPDGHLSEKPPLYYWMGAGLSALFGEGEWPLRAVSVLFALGTLLVVGWTASRLAPSPAAALAVGALGCNILFVAWARTAMVDMVFTFFLTAGLCAYLGARLGRWGAWSAATLCGIAYGLAVLTKGPLGLAFPLLAIGLDVLVATRGRFWRVSHLAAPAALSAFLVLEISLMWYLPGWLAGGKEFLYTSILDENLFMPLGISHGIAGSHVKPLWYYPLRQLMILLPVAALLPEAVRRASKREGGPAFGILLTWAAAMLAVLFAASNKRWYYLLPLQPVVALMIAFVLAPRWKAEATPLLKWSVRAVGATVAFAALMAAACAFTTSEAHEAGTLVGLVRQNMGLLAASGVALSWAGFLMLGSSFFSGAAMIRTTLLVGFLAVGIRSVLIDPIQGKRDRIRPFVTEASKHVGPGKRVAMWPPEYGYGFDFYWPGVERGEGPVNSAEFLLVREALIPRLPFRVEVVGRVEFSSEERHVALVRRMN